jgi:hypothetical protein
MNLKPILRLRGPASTSFYFALCVAVLLTGSANAQNPLSVTTTSIASSANPATLEQPITFTASVAASGGTPTGMVVFKDGSDTFGTVPLQADGSAKLAISTLAVANHVITAAYSGDAEFAGSLSAPLTQVVDKFATVIAVASSANPAPPGQPVALTATVKGLNGTATGTVTFNVGSDALGTSALAADGSAKISLSQLSAGSHAVVASFGGDARHAGSTSPVLTQVVGKSATTTTLASSANPATVGHSVTFTARVAGAGGTPTGTVTLKDGANILGFGFVSADGTAKVAVSTLASGLHAVTAAYEGDGIFAPSVSAAYEQMLEPASVSYQQVAILIATIIVAALLVLSRGVALAVVARIFRWLLRPVWLGGRYALRFLRILSRRRPQRPADAFLGLSVQTLSQAFTETENAIKEDFDPSSIPIDRHRRLVCFWLHPVPQNKGGLAAPNDGDYEKTQAAADFKKAESFFNIDVQPLKTNALNLYDDVHNAFIVKLFKDSDKPCFHVLSEFRKTINSNVTMLSVIFSLIVSVVAVLNILWSRSVDFYKLAGVPQGRWLPPVIGFLGVEFQTQAVVNTAIFGAVSCLFGFGLMWMFYQIAYDQSQRHNELQLNNFLVRYLADINIQFTKIHTRATQAVVEDTEIEAMKKDSVLWMTNLQWMAFRAFFIEEFLRSVLFQARRNSIYALFLIPAFFIFAMLLVAWLLNIHQFNFLDFQSDIYRQNTFYLFFAWLVYIYYKYMTRSYQPVVESIDGSWSKFRELNLQGAMTRILESYANQLDQWRTRFRERGGPMG